MVPKWYMVPNGNTFRIFRKKFRSILKRKKDDQTKEQLENVAFGDDHSEADGAVICRRVGFFSSRGFFPHN